MGMLTVTSVQFFVCGSSKIASGVKRVLIEIIKESRHLDDEAALAAFDEMMNGRYATDIFE